MLKEESRATQSDTDEARTMLMSSSSERSLSSNEEEKSQDESIASEEHNCSGSPTTKCCPSRQLKKTCEQCARSKVKCDGGHPCGRCVKRGVDCQFLAEQKRGRRTLLTCEPNSSIMDKKQVRPETEVKRAKTVSSQRRHSLPLFEAHASQPLIASQTSLLQPIWPKTPYRGFASPFSGFSSPPTLLHAPLAPNFKQPRLFQPIMSTFPPVQPLVSPLRAPMVRMLRTLAALYRHRATNGLSGDINKTWFETFFYRALVLLNAMMSVDAAGVLMNWMTRAGLVSGASMSPTIAPDGKRAGTIRLQPALPPGVTFGIGHVNVVPGQGFDCSSDLTAMTGYTAQDISAEFAGVTECLPWGAQVMLVMGAEDSAAYTHIEMAAAALDVAKRGKISQVTWCMPLVIKPRNSAMPLDSYIMSTAMLNPSADDFASIRLSFFYVPPTIKCLPSPNSATLSLLGPWDEWPSSSSPAQSTSALVAWMDA